jgi:hypothetical protein
VAGRCRRHDEAQSGRGRLAAPPSGQAGEARVA